MVISFDIYEDEIERYPEWAKDLNSIDISKSSKENYDKIFVPHDLDNLSLGDLNIGAKSLFNERNAKIESFSIGRQIGCGSFGVIYLARHENLYVCIKMVNKSLKIEEKVKYLLKESKFLKMLDHQNIIKFYDFFHDEKRCYLITEYAPKKLSDIRAEDEKLISKIFRQAVLAVQECHKNNIIHRDIKVENFVIGYDGNLKLIDFGLSCFCSPGQFKNKTRGTLCCMSPEMISSRYRSLVDIWSLGVLLYELSNHCNPFDDDDYVITKLNIKYVSYKFTSETLSDDLKFLIENLLKYDDSKRLTFEQILQHKWLCLGRVF